MIENPLGLGKFCISQSNRIFWLVLSHSFIITYPDNQSLPKSTYRIGYGIFRCPVLWHWKEGRKTAFPLKTRWTQNLPRLHSHCRQRKSSLPFEILCFCHSCLRPALCRPREGCSQLLSGGPLRERAQSRDICFHPYMTQENVNQEFKFSRMPLELLVLAGDILFTYLNFPLQSFFTKIS